MQTNKKNCRRWRNLMYYHHLVISMSSLIAEPLGPIIDPDMALDIRNLIEMRLLIDCNFGVGLGVTTLSVGGLEFRNDLSLLFLELLLALVFMRISHLSFLQAKIIVSSDWFIYEAIILISVGRKCLLVWLKARTKAVKVWPLLDIQNRSHHKGGTIIANCWGLMRLSTGTSARNTSRRCGKKYLRWTISITTGSEQCR